MAVEVTEFEVEYSMEADVRLARLEERTEHIRRDVTEVKGDVRRVEAKLDSLSEKVSAGQVSMIMWAVGTAITVATLAFTVAKFVK